MIDHIAIPALALVRRIHGGWLGTSHTFAAALYAELCMLVFYDQPLAAIPAFAATCLMMFPSHDYDPDEGLSRRYLGPVFGAGYMVAKDLANRVPKHRELCWSCVGELYLGAAWGLCLVAAKHVGLALGGA